MTIALSGGGLYKAASEQSFDEFDVFEAGEMGKCIDLSNFD